MRYLSSFITAVFLGVFVMVSAPSYGAEIPKLQGRINDYAGMLSADTKQALNHTLEALESSDSTQVVVLTIPSLDGEDIEGFSIKVAEEWKIGQKGKDNGVILLISKNDKKVRIEVGYGLEGKLTDLVSSHIIREQIAPKFKEGKFDEGTTAGIGAISQAVKGEYKATEKKKEGSSDLFLLGAGGLFIIALILCFVAEVIGPWGCTAVGAFVGPVAVHFTSFLGSSLFLGSFCGAVCGFLFYFIGPFFLQFGGAAIGAFGGGGGSFGGGGSSGSWD